MCFEKEKLNLWANWTAARGTLQVVMKQLAWKTFSYYLDYTDADALY